MYYFEDICLSLKLKLNKCNNIGCYQHCLMRFILVVRFWLKLINQFLIVVNLAFDLIMCELIGILEEIQVCSGTNTIVQSMEVKNERNKIRKKKKEASLEVNHLLIVAGRWWLWWRKSERERERRKIYVVILAALKKGCLHESFYLLNITVDSNFSLFSVI